MQNPGDRNVVGLSGRFKEQRGSQCGWNTERKEESCEGREEVREGGEEGERERLGHAGRGLEFYSMYNRMESYQGK